MNQRREKIDFLMNEREHFLSRNQRKLFAQRRHEENENHPAKNTSDLVWLLLDVVDMALILILI